MNEQRRFDRFLLDIEIEHYKKDEDQKISKTKSKNISKGGICITTDGEPLIKDKKYILRFTLPGQDEQMTIEGKVVWNEKYMTGNTVLFDNGMEFINISKRQLKMIETFRLGSVYEP